jgi:acyl carrier protein
MIGGWLLYSLLKHTALDFFVCFSSAASLFGSAGQGNYAAAGAFLDALTHHLRALGQPALSIDWGAVSETGFGATTEGLKVHEYWESRGIHRITPKQVLTALEQLIPQNVSQVGVIRLDWRLLQQFYPQLANLPLVSHLIAETGSDSTHGVAIAREDSSFIQTLLSADQKERRQLLESYLCKQVAGVLRLSATKIDILQPLTALGLDSLMAIELKNRIELELGVRIPIITFLQGPSIAEFAGQVLDQLTPVPSTRSAIARESDQVQQANKGITPVNKENAQQLLAELDQLSDAEVDSLLSTILRKKNGQIRALDRINQQPAKRMLVELDQLSDQE